MYNPYKAEASSNHRCCAGEPQICSSSGLRPPAERGWQLPVRRPHPSFLGTAERRLLGTWLQRAKKHNVPSHRIVTWVRRKAGAHITVWRTLADGSFGCAAPCVLCAKELMRFDLNLHCPINSVEWYQGRASDEGAPAPKLTTRQRLMFKRHQA